MRVDGGIANEMQAHLCAFLANYVGGFDRTS